MEQAYEEERKKLERVIQHIEAGQSQLKLAGQTPVHPRASAAPLKEFLGEYGDGLNLALAQPYFGRIDYADLSDTAIRPDMSIYIGATQIMKEDVCSWTAPVARLWYTNESSYTARGQGRRSERNIPVRVDLKRFLRIRDKQLLEINDIFRRMLAGPTDIDKSALADALSSVGEDGRRLQAIIETIEPHQYEAIANQRNPALIVQGAPGSGKSEIGLHRIAYLLSPFNEIESATPPTPETTLFIGPSKAFLEYARDVLPTLNVSAGVQQTTLRDWFLDRRATRLRVRDGLLGNLNDQGRMKVETFKGSLAMADMLDKHVRRLTERVRRQCRALSGFPIEIDAGRSVQVMTSDIQKSLQAALARASDGTGLNSRRQTFLRLAADAVLERYWEIRDAFGEDTESRRRTVSRQVAEYCNDAWPRYDVRRSYVALLQDVDTVLRLARNNLSEDEAHTLKVSAGRMLDGGFLDSDEGALTYLDHLFNGTIKRQYRHIVVDEAQDVSPIEFKLLSLASTNNLFTVLGDLAQRLTPYRGIHRWRALDRVLGRAETAVQYARLSYRSNKHITRFNNRILRLFNKSLPAPTPFDRDGHRPEIHRHSTNNAMHRCVIEDLSRIRSLPGFSDARIAILARDRNIFNEFYTGCVDAGRDDIEFADRSSFSTSRTILAQIPEVRGLEYDAVIVLGVNVSFSNTEFNQKLLYLATTRAKHYLAIHWARRISPILTDISLRGIREVDRRNQ